MLDFFWSDDGSKRDLAEKQARSYCLSVIFSENRFPLFRIMLAQSRSKLGLSRGALPQKGSPADRTGHLIHCGAI